MKWLSVLALALLLVTPPGLAAQAAGTISGTITGTNGRPLSGAAIAVAGTSRGSQSDAQGHFTITAVPTGSRTVRASFAGYSEATRTITVAAGQSATVNIQLAVQAVRLEEIVAVGYGTARRRDVAGAVASVRPAETGLSAPQAASAVAGALQGKAPGVQVVSNSGAPGAGVSVRVRGSNSITANAEPLYVVDGLPVAQGASGVDSNPLAALDPSDIESMEILKDASQTAIYGARGANGVVLITTRRGTRGQNRIEFESTVGTQRISRDIEVLNAQQFMEFTNEANRNAGRAQPYTAAQIADAQTYNYVDAILRRAPQMSHSVTISGGDERTRYLLGGNYAQQEGIILGTTFGRYGARFNLDRNVSDRFRVGNSLSLVYVLQHQPAGDGVIATAMQYLPWVPYRDQNGVWLRDLTTFGIQGIGSNPVATVSEVINDQNQWRGIGNLYGEYDLAEGLMLRSTLGGNFGFTRDGTYNPRTIAQGFNTNGSATLRSESTRELTNENTLTYRREVGPGNLDLVVGASVQRFRSMADSLAGQNFPSDVLSYNALGSASSNRSIASRRDEWTLLSQLGRLNYNLLDRYIFTLTARRDGSSRFGANNKWAFFPSAAFAWRLLDEPFLQDQTLFTDLKFRVSYGRTGNQAIEPYQSLPLLTTEFVGIGRTPTEQAAISPTTAAPNDDLKWETQSQFNVGADLGFFDNRVTITADAYQSNTSDLLFNVDLPHLSGYTSQLQNVGSVRNRGVEVALNTLNYDGDFFSWSSSLNISRNRNEVTSLYGGVTQFLPARTFQGLDATNVNIVKVGEPLGSIYGYRTEGLYQAGDACRVKTKVDCTPGELKYVDTNGDSLVTIADRQIIGNGDPDFYGGFNNSLKFGPVSLDAFFNFSYGNELANMALLFSGSSRALTNERADIVLDRWTPENTNTEVPRANNARIGRLTDYIVEDASFARLQTLTIGYRLPAGLIPTASTARLYISGQNVWLLTNYNGFDPEANSRGGSSTERGMDIGAYPRARTWNVGANLTF
jgi:TonB-dependent starch-binding outer membrane protein SusC